MKYWDWLEWLMATIVTLTVGLLGFVFVLLYMEVTHETQGYVVSKYYDDPDLVCAKVCVWTDECWRLRTDNEGWWDDGLCVSRDYYDTVQIGDYVKEG